MKKSAQEKNNASRTTSFSRQVKDELCQISADASCCLRLELLLGLTSAGRFQPDRIVFATGHAAYADHLIQQMKEFYGFTVDVRHGSELLTLNFTGQSARELLLADLKALVGFDSVSGLMTEHLIKDECCQRAALRGAFLACGSIAEPKRSYHLEFAVHRAEAAELIGFLLKQLDIRSSLLERNGYTVVYFKEGELIAEFLLQTGAHVSLLLFESLRVDKEMRNTVNRVVNCDNANAQRIANTSARQLQLLRELENSNVLGLLSAELQEAARARLANPHLSLRELGEIMDPPIGKSGMNHRLKKLETIAAGLPQNEDAAHITND